MPFIPVANATQLMPPTRLFVRLREELAPFAYEVPPEYNAYVSTLKEAGCRDVPTSVDLLQILRVKHTCNRRPFKNRTKTSFVKAARSTSLLLASLAL